MDRFLPFKKFVFIIILGLWQTACSQPLKQVEPTIVKVEISQLDQLEKVEKDDRYIAEIELHTQIQRKFPYLKTYCSVRRVFVYFENYEYGEVASFPSMEISVIGKDYVIESYARNEEDMEYYAKAIAQFGKRDLKSFKPVVIDFGASLAIRVRVRERVTIPQLIYLLRHDRRGFKYARYQYICRDLPGRQVKKLKEYLVRFQKEFVTE